MDQMNLLSTVDSLVATYLEAGLGVVVVVVVELLGLLFLLVLVGAFSLITLPVDLLWKERLYIYWIS